MMLGFTKLDNPNHTGATDTWLTPRWLLDKLGKFDLDPCAYKGWDTAKESYFTHGLDNPWFGRVWLNPPYGKNIHLWLNRLADHNHGIALVFARTDTQWFHDIFSKCDHMFLFKGRIRFLTSTFVESTNAGHGSCLIVFGENKQDYRLNGVWIK